MVSTVAVDSEKASFLLTIVEKPENTRFFFIRIYIFKIIEAEICEILRIFPEAELIVKKV